MLSRLSRAYSAINNFLWFDTYPIKTCLRMWSKDHSLPRKLCYCTIALASALLGIYLGINIGGYLGFIGGFSLGTAIGTLVLPGPGSAIGATIGGSIGMIVGEFCGWKAGIEAIGMVGAFVAKHTLRAVSAILNFKQANPTYPNKYKLTTDEAEFIRFLNEIKHSNRYSSSQKLYFPVNKTISNEIKKTNEALAECYQWKKNEVKPNLFFRILGVSHYFFDKQKEMTNQAINRAAKDLKCVDKQKYEELRQTFAKRA